MSKRFRWLESVVLYLQLSTSSVPRAQITQGRKVLSTLDSLSKLVEREQSVSIIISSAGDMLPQVLRFVRRIQEVEIEEALKRMKSGKAMGPDGIPIEKYLLEKRAVVDVDNGKLLNEDNDIRSANDSEIPLLHEFNGTAKEAGSTLEGEVSIGKIPHEPSGDIAFDAPEGDTSFEKPNAEQTEALPYPELPHGCLANDFLKRFDIDDRSVVSHIFHHWAKKVAFQNPKRLLDKVPTYADFHHPTEIVEVQISYLRNLGCTIIPTSRLHASHLIEKYKSL
ncbi:hypothetical protein PR202_gb20882 [Eleusine coracana subsp. coracana]|uniref:Uncharacterized protein n=1 Tax=Eleusine coracana subsp. coracana TaxID=191504 RepID=A0AAV5FBM8_ELECO|nr:hypothetical protein PR202_gb20882 [Eleusine coracana subsp. coracana]